MPRRNSTRQHLLPPIHDQSPFPSEGTIYSTIHVQQSSVTIPETAQLPTLDFQTTSSSIIDESQSQLLPQTTTPSLQYMSPFPSSQLTLREPQSQSSDYSQGSIFSISSTDQDFESSDENNLDNPSNSKLFYQS
jgi:hypothetical protein